MQQNGCLHDGDTGSAACCLVHNQIHLLHSFRAEINEIGIVLRTLVARIDGIIDGLNGVQGVKGK